MYEANSWSNALTFGPMVSCMLSSTSSIAARTSSRIVAYCAFRSTRGISSVATAVMALWSPSYLHPLREVLEPRVGMRVDADEAREVANVVLELDGRITCPNGPRRDCVAYHAPRADERVLADLNTREDRAVRADARATADHPTLHAVEIGGALRVRIVGENHVRPEEDIVVDLRELEETTGVDAHARADPIAELERGMCPDRDVVADHIVLADGCALPRLETRADARSGIDRRERADDRSGTDDELELAVLLAARGASHDPVLADNASLAEADVRRNDRGGMHGRLHAGAHTRTGSSRYATRAPPDRSDRIASSSTRTTVRPASPSLRGFLPSRTHSMK